jgi:drug/metabolite transporter (DMT)-like permease
VNKQSFARVAVITSAAMIAFASNSLLCRIALRDTGIDAATFTSIRLVFGAIMLWIIVGMSRTERNGSGNWFSASALFVYAAGFTFAYVNLPAATGALLLFGAVQTTMIGGGIRLGERLRGVQLIGLILAFGGLVGLLLPGISSPPLFGSLLMVSAGVAWGIYSLRGKEIGNPTKVTAGNFLRAAIIAVVLSIFMRDALSMDKIGIFYAVISGAVTSGLGYVLWYTVLPMLKATQAATVQLTVPVIAAVGGTLFLGESITLRLILASAAILGGIALVILEKTKHQ